MQMLRSLKKNCYLYARHIIGTHMSAFPNNTVIGKYSVKRCIKENEFTTSYLVSGENAENFFMKVFRVSQVPNRLKKDGKVLEILNSKRIDIPNIISYTDSGEFRYEEEEYQYLVTPFFKGRMLSEVLKVELVFGEDEAMDIAVTLLKALAALNKSTGLCHNDLCPQNILLEKSEQGKWIPTIIDLGHLSEPVSGAPIFPVEDLNTLYMAPEQLKGIFFPEGDVYSLAVILFQLLTGEPPWICHLSGCVNYYERKEAVRAARTQGFILPEGMQDATAVFLQEGLRDLRKERPTPEEMLKRLNAPHKPLDKTGESKGTGQKDKGPAPEKEPGMQVHVEVKKNESGKGGFADVAGMDALKQDLYRRVIWVLKDREKAKRYRLTPPNGMLLYGPPGCGKTFFAQKFAEESGFNYILVNGSDLGSTYVHGTQGKIAELFKQAAENPPTVICFDEFDSFVPSRGSDSATHRADEVNEFLSQLNNCSARGIFVIGTTNRMDMIDPAVLRKGRLDLHVEIPAPDAATRKLMFRIHLKDRPQEEDIDLDRLAELTEGYASSDIAFIVNEAAMVAALADQNIGNSHLEESIRNNPSSLGTEKKRNRIGF